MLLMTALTAARVEIAGNDLGDVCAILSAHRRGRPLIARGDAIASAARTMAENPAICGLQFVVKNDDESVELIKVGARGEVERVALIWNSAGVPV